MAQKKFKPPILLYLPAPFFAQEQNVFVEFSLPDINLADKGTNGDE